MNWNQPEDEDFKEAKDESSVSTADEFGDLLEQNLVDEPNVVPAKVGDIVDCY